MGGGSFNLVKHAWSVTSVGKAAGYKLSASELVLYSTGTVTVQQPRCPLTKHTDAFLFEFLLEKQKLLFNNWTNVG